jgi:hypothetical protein
MNVRNNNYEVGFNIVIRSLEFLFCNYSGAVL